MSTENDDNTRNRISILITSKDLFIRLIVSVIISFYISVPFLRRGSARFVGEQVTEDESSLSSSWWLYIWCRRSSTKMLLLLLLVEDALRKSRALWLSSIGGGGKGVGRGSWRAARLAAAALSLSSCPGSRGLKTASSSSTNCGTPVTVLNKEEGPWLPFI